MVSKIAIFFFIIGFISLGFLICMLITGGGNKGIHVENSQESYNENINLNRLISSLSNNNSNQDLIVVNIFNNSSK